MVLILGVVAVAAVISYGLVWAAWSQHPDRGARFFAVAASGVAWTLTCVVVSQSLWLAGYDTLGWLFNSLKWTGFQVICLGLFAFAMAYTGRDSFVTRRRLVLLSVFPTTALVVPTTRSLVIGLYEGLFGITITVSSDPILVPWQVANVAYLYLLVAAASAALFSVIFTNRRFHPIQSALWLVAITVPWTINIIYVANILPRVGSPPVDPTPLGYFVTGVVGLVAITRYDVFGSAPVARAYVVDQLDTGVVVFDEDYLVVDYNDWAADALGLAAGTLEKDVRTVLAERTTLGPATDAIPARDPFIGRIDGAEFHATDSDGVRESRVFEADVSGLERKYTNRHSGTDGYALVIRDVTERIRHERRLERQNEQLEILNRIVRHDIRNDMNLALEILRRLQREPDDGGQTDRERDYLDQVVRMGERVVDLTETARNLVQAITATQDDEPVALAPVLTETVVNASTLSADAAVRIEGDLPEVAVRANDMLPSVFRNLLSNAIQYNDSDHPEVVVSVSLSDECVTIRIVDNGPGIPESERETVFTEAKTLDSNSGTGFGLYLVEMLVDAYGGDVWVEDAGERIDLDGAAFIVELEVVEKQFP